MISVVVSLSGACLFCVGIATRVGGQDDAEELLVLMLAFGTIIFFRFLVPFPPLPPRVGTRAITIVIFLVLLFVES